MALIDRTALTDAVREVFSGEHTVREAVINRLNDDTLALDDVSQFAAILGNTAIALERTLAEEFQRVDALIEPGS